MVASKPEKTMAEANYVRASLLTTMKESKISQHKLAGMLKINQSNICKFLAGATQLNDEAIELLYENDLVRRPTEQDLEKVQEQVSPEGKEGIEYVPVADLRPHPANHLIYGDNADEDLVNSIRENGVLSPLLVTTAGILVSGHRRLDAARRAGLDEVPVIRCEKTDELEVEALLIEANKQRQKNAEQIGREYVRLKEIEEEKAKRRMSEGAQGVVNSSPPGKSRDLAAQKLGIGTQRAERAAAVVREIDTLKASGEIEKAENLKSTLNTQSVNAAFENIRLRHPREKKENDSLKTKRAEEENVQKMSLQVANLQDEIERLRKENAALKRTIPVFRRDGRKIEGWEISTCREARGWRVYRSDGKTGYVPIAEGEIGFIASDTLANALEAELERADLSKVV